jgi:5-methylthioadenosine/S-adenosylhomocysteine deaminase
MSTIDLKIDHALVVTVDENDTIIYDGCVCVHNGIICAVGTSEECAEYNAEMLIDAQGNLIMPGLINGHTHAGMW